LWRRLLVVSVAVLLGLAFAGAVRADELDDRVRAIARELRCIVCQGETVADSNAQLSVQMRALIREKLEAGESREQILDYFVARYGERILATPPRRGFALGVWLAPVVALLVGLAIVGVVLRGWRRGVATATPVAQPPAVPQLSGDEERLERELERFRREGARG
jgi:cytochrome c-type biogenesis protein CcmH